MRFIFSLIFLILLSQVSAQVNNSPLKSYYSILFLGDSYTVGEGVSYSDSYPGLLEQRFNKNNISLSKLIIAKTGWTTGELIHAIAGSTDINPPYDKVFLLIGVNNQYRSYSIDQYEQEFSNLLEKSIQYTNHKSDNVYVLSIPDWGCTPFANGRDKQQIAREIDAFNEVNKRLSADFKVNYISVTDISRFAATDHTLIASDGLHPSGKMYQLWVEEILKIFK